MPAPSFGERESLSPFAAALSEQLRLQGIQGASAAVPRQPPRVVPDPSIISQLVEQMGFNANAANRAVTAGNFCLIAHVFIVALCNWTIIFVSDPIPVHSVGPDTIFAAAVDWLEAVSCVFVM